MTDRELLELAAEAYWAGEDDDVVSLEWSDADNGVLYTLADNQDHNGLDRTYVWNPLEDDAAALLLAVKLRLDIEQRDDYVVVWSGLIGTGKIPHDNEPLVATRRAIVLAAAEIGRGLAEKPEGK